MGFFSGIRRRIKKLIPKEVRPFIPYIAAAIPGAGLGLGALGGTGAMGSFLRAATAKGLTDDEADIKDVLRTGAIAAAPQAISKGLNFAGDSLITDATLGNTAGTGKLEFAQALKSAGNSNMLNPSGIMGQAKMVGAQGSIDYGLKAAELNEDALAEYNRMLAEQGINDKAGRRAAIRAIYSNTGTWDMDEVDEMLDTYGYRTGGRVGYAEGGMSDIEKKIQIMREAGMTEKQIVEYLQGRMGDISQEAMMFEDAYSPITNMEEGMPKELAIMQLEEALSTPGMENVGIRSVIDIVDKAADKQQLDNSLRKLERDVIDYDAPPSDYELRVKRLGLENGGETEEERRRRKRREKFTEGFEYAQEGLESLEELDDEIKPLPIRELRLARGGRVSELKAAYQRYLEMARKDGSKKIIPFEIFAEEFARENFARGGITDINMEEQIDTPSGDMMMDENIQVASDPSPMDELDSLSLMLFRKPLSELTDDEYEDLKDFASQQSLKPGLIDEYRNYKYNAEEQGQTPMSPRDYFRMEFGAARMGVARGGIMDVNTNMQLDIPDMGREDVDVNEEMLMAGGGARGEKAQELAQMLVDEKYPGSDFDFYDLSDDEQMKIYEIALDMVDTGGYKKGGKVIELMPKGILYKGKAKDYPGIKQLIKDMKKKGTRPKKAEGGLMSMGGNEMDLRGGGFVPMGAKERADDVPARLSKNEFVMTADAVRGAGGGSVQKGADLMYDQMKQLERQA